MSISRKIIVTKEEILEMYNFYLKEKSLVKTSKHFKKCTKYIGRWFKEENLNFPIKEFGKKWEYNEKYFKDINTENKAYLLGFIFADGGLYYRKKNKNSIEKCLTINIVEDDIEILNFFKKELNYNGNFYRKDPKTFISTNKKEYTRKSQVSVSISSITLCTYLEQYGLTNRKTYNETPLPNIPNDLMHHFIRGYFDGDGCSYIKGFHKMCSFTSKKSMFLYSFQNLLLSIDINSKVRHDKTRDVYVLTFLGLKNVTNFYNYIYTNSSFSLNRKMLKFKNALYKLDELLEKPEEVNQQPS